MRDDHSNEGEVTEEAMELFVSHDIPLQHKPNNGGCTDTGAPGFLAIITEKQMDMYESRNDEEEQKEGRNCKDKGIKSSQVVSAGGGNQLGSQLYLAKSNLNHAPSDIIKNKIFSRDCKLLSNKTIAAAAVGFGGKQASKTRDSAIGGGICGHHQAPHKN